MLKKHLNLRCKNASLYVSTLTYWAILYKWNCLFLSLSLNSCSFNLENIIRVLKILVVELNVNVFQMHNSSNTCCPNHSILEALCMLELGYVKSKKKKKSHYNGWKSNTQGAITDSSNKTMLQWATTDIKCSQGRHTQPVSITSQKEKYQGFF